MSTHLLSKIDHDWYGKYTRSVSTPRTFQYKGFIKRELTRKSTRIHLGACVLVEAENPDQPYVAQLLNLYEDDAQRKHAVVQWFSRFTDIPENQRKQLKRTVDPQEVFYDETPGYNVDIALETIIKTVTVVPLHPWEELPVALKKTDTFYVKQSWDGRCFKDLTPDVFSKLKGSDEEGLDQLNSPTRSPESQLQGSEVLDAAQDTVAPLKSPPRKRKMNFTGILSSPSKIPCPSEKSASVFYTAEEWQRFSDKPKDLDVKENTENTVNILNAVNLKPEEYSQSGSDTSYSSDWEEDNDIQYIPEKKHSFPVPPRTSPNAAPETSRHSPAVQNAASLLAEARLRLHVSAVPESLPCREEELQSIYTFVESNLVDGTGGCMYIAGMPGTGKTATVQEAIRCLEQAVEDDCIPSFQLVEINGMRLTDPHEFYVQLVESLTGQRVTAAHAAALLAKLFSTPGTNRRATVLVVDELDLLWTQKQDVLYNLFDWPSWKHSKLIVLAIANTTDLPDRMMLNRVASRVCFTRMPFEPYSCRELEEIILSRLENINVFDEDAVQLVAALSGDARRCLNICRRATEICEFAGQSSTSEKVRVVHVTKAIDEMFSSPYINFIRNASLHEQIFLKAILAEFCRTGFEEATLHQIYHQHVALCRVEGIPCPTVSDIMAVCSRLSACRLLLTGPSTEYLDMRVRLNISRDDLISALNSHTIC